MVIFGPYVSENGVPLARYIDELGEVPCITMAATETMLGEWVFALNNGSMEEEPVIMAAVAKHDGREAVGIAYEQSLIGQDYLRVARTRVRRRGPEDHRRGGDPAGRGRASGGNGGASGR